MELTVEELSTLWSAWSQDKTLQIERFGQFVCNRKLNSGYCWPRCFYASTEDAWVLLHEVATGLKPFSGRRVY